MKKLSVFDVLKIGGAVVRSIKRIREEIKAAKDPESPGGSKVLPGEALGAVLRGLIDATPEVYETVSGEPIPADLDILDALADL